MRTTPIIRIVSAITLVSHVAFFIGVYGEMDALARAAGVASVAAAAVLAVIGFAARRWALAVVALIGAVGWILWFFGTAPSEIPLAKAAVAIFGSLIAAIIGLFAPKPRG